ncbi:MAG: spondin domain-containing protein [Candidatus Cyclobacteriaceae bacterium M3_2C_046]
MKHLIRLLKVSLSFTVVFLLASCQQEEVPVTDPAGIQFDLTSGVISSSENGRIKEQPLVKPGYCDLSLAAYAKVEINGSQEYKIDIQAWEGSYKTNLLELDPGEYQVTKLVVYNHEDKALFATPTMESPFKNFVSMALPLNFTIANHQKLDYPVEVLCVEDFTPPQFGFSFWDIDLKQTKQLCLFANYCDPAEGHRVAPLTAYVFPDKEENMEELIYKTASEGADDLACLRFPYDPDVAPDQQKYWLVVEIHDQKFAGYLDLAMVDHINQEYGYLHLNKNCEGDYGPLMKKFTMTIYNVFEPKLFFLSGAFDTPVGADNPGPAFPNDYYQFKFYAAPGSLLSTAFMYVQSNDILFTTPEGGLPLFDEEGMPISGDITSYFGLYDAGTEINQEPGIGPDQAPRQAGPDTGADENGVVLPIAEVNDGFTYPDVAESIKVMVTPGEGNMFTVMIKNISGNTVPASPLSPGVWVVHNDQVQLYTVGEPASPGLEDIAEDGNVKVMAEFLSENSGLVSPISPGAFAVHYPGIMPLFTGGEPALHNGLEEIAEDGSPEMMLNYLDGLAGVKQHGIIITDPPAPVFPGQAVSFSFYASGPSYLNFAVMLIQSNDYFFAFDDTGLPLFDPASGLPMTGDVTAYVKIWNAGTEVDQFPGAGPDQAPRQAGTDTGADQNGVVSEEVHEIIPAVEDMVKVILE